MKAKFTLFIAVGLLVSMATMAQGRSYENDNRDYGYKNDSRYERHDNFDYRAKMFSLQQQLNHEVNELDRARAYRDWDKVRYEKREIAEIRYQIKQLQRSNYFDKFHDGHDRF
jgi:hypothetical protein